MDDKDTAVVNGMLISVQAVLKEVSAQLSRGGGIVGTPQDRARIELATAMQATEMVRFWVSKVT